MKQYVGCFPVNKGLTKKLGVEDFVVYRDPENGLYACSESRGLDVNLESWNETVKDITESTLEEWRSMIAYSIKTDGLWTHEWAQYC